MSWERDVSRLTAESDTLPTVAPAELYTATAESEEFDTGPDEADLEAGDYEPVAGEDYDLGPDAVRIGTPSNPWPITYATMVGGGVLAAEESHLLGGALVVGHGEGVLRTAILSTDTAIDFGQEMAPGDFVFFKRAGVSEYLAIGALVVDFVYNVTRDLAGTGAQDWPLGTPFLVLGQSGDGRLEIDGVNKCYSIKLQGPTYDAYTEPVRVGNLNGWGPYSTTYGIALGDPVAGNYLAYEPVGGFRLVAGAGDMTIDADGISLVMGNVNREGALVTQEINWLTSADITTGDTRGASIRGYMNPREAGGQNSLELLARCCEPVAGILQRGVVDIWADVNVDGTDWALLRVGENDTITGSPQVMMYVAQSQVDKAHIYVQPDLVELMAAVIRLKGSVTFDADNSHDIGAAGASRPRDLYLGRNLRVGGTIAGHVAGDYREEAGTVTSSNSADTSVTFGTAFSSAPRVFCQVTGAVNVCCTPIVRTPTTTGFDFGVFNADGSRRSISVRWLAVGPK
jgi:hypothetical protein